MLKKKQPGSDSAGQLPAEEILWAAEGAGGSRQVIIIARLPSHSTLQDGLPSIVNPSKIVVMACTDRR